MCSDDMENILKYHWLKPSWQQYNGNNVIYLAPASKEFLCQTVTMFFKEKNGDGRPSSCFGSFFPVEKLILSSSLTLACINCCLS